MKLGRDMHAALDPRHRAMIAPQPISIETDQRPFARLLHLQDGKNEVRGVWISAGFIDLVNCVAHAEAIDAKETGYFNRYMRLLEEGVADQALSDLPGIGEERYWTDAMLNEQQSNFNSIVGLVVGIKLANHYLGQQRKYAKQLERNDGRAVAINNLLTREEWEEAFRHGVRNAARAGCMMEGALPFYEAIDRIKERPDWTAFFLPDDVKFARMRDEVKRIQSRLLRGGRD